MISTHFRLDFPAHGAAVTALALFGTAGPTGVSAFDTADVIRGYRASASRRAGRCDEFVEGDVPIQLDAGHLTAEGAVEVARRLSMAFVKKLGRADDVVR